MTPRPLETTRRSPAGRLSRRRRIRFAIAAALAAWLLALASTAAAQELDLYEGEVVVPDQDAGTRQAALPQALAQAFVKLTGDAAAAEDPALAARLADATRLMQQYRYRQDVVQEGGSARTRLSLIARFDPAGVDQLLAEAGRAVWPSPRPPVLLWLAIDDGRGPRLVSSAQAGAVSALAARGRQRGLRFEYPLLDLQDQQAAAVSDVLDGRHDVIAGASARYQSAVQLVGHMRRTGSSWDARWTLLDGGQVLSSWQASDRDPQVVLAAGADGAADALSARYAATDAGSAGEYQVEIVALDSAEDYLRAIAHLQGLGVVRGYRVVSADGGRLRLALELSTGIGGLTRMLQAARVLEVLEHASTGAAPGTPAGVEPGAEARAPDDAGRRAGVDAVLRLTP